MNEDTVMHDGMSASRHKWLTECPASDINFKGEVKAASAAELRRAIEAIKGKAEKRTALKALETRLRRIEK